ncbi:MAG: hypothetical protein ABSH38_07710 [Verrucomicrobiota bacterium]|jgi:hypothetical protein
MKTAVPLLALWLTACQAPQPLDFRPDPPSDRDGVTLEQAREAALRLWPGQTAENVRALLGRPDETSASVYGQATPAPWDGTAWTYRWERYGVTEKRLVVILVILPDGPRVNNWEWYDF